MGHGVGNSAGRENRAAVFKHAWSCWADTLSQNPIIFKGLGSPEILHQVFANCRSVAVIVIAIQFLCMVEIAQALIDAIREQRAVLFLGA